MTALSIYPGCTDRRHPRPVVTAAVSTLATRTAGSLDQALSRAGDWALEHMLGAAGGMTLALAPFSFLAWMFIAR